MTTITETRPGTILHHPEIGDLERPAQKLLTQLAPNINAGAYTVILGDDASGRIPTLILRRVVGNIYQRLGFPEPETFFFTSVAFGSSSELTPPKSQMMMEKFVEFINKACIPEKTKDRKILVVTDTVDTGRHLYPYLQSLQEQGVHCDVAAIVAKLNHNPFNNLGTGLYRGQRNYNLRIYRRSNLSGVRKDDDFFAIFATPFIHRARLETRRDIEVVAQRLTQWYVQEHLPQTAAA